MNKRRINLVLTPKASAVLDEICKLGESTITETLKQSLLLMKICADAVRDGKQIRLVNPKDPKEVCVVELPFFWKEQSNGK